MKKSSKCVVLIIREQSPTAKKAIPFYATSNGYLGMAVEVSI